MHTQPMHEALAEAIVGRHLLTRPFYRRWEAGTLTEGELAAYAEQYRHIERELPVTLAAIADGLPGTRSGARGGEPADKLGSPEPHTELFETRGGGGCRTGHAGDAVDGGPARGRTDDGSNDPVAALAMVAAYQVQAADIAPLQG